MEDIPVKISRTHSEKCFFFLPPFDRNEEFFSIAGTKYKNFAIVWWCFYGETIKGKLVVHGNSRFYDVSLVGGVSYPVVHYVNSM